METKTIRIKTALRAVMVMLMMGVVGITKGYAQGSVPTGAIDGLFSVGENQQVYFSKGNLQYRASTNTWRFAENQWDFIGSANSNISWPYSGWIDLLGWGTSGYNHGANCYQPWSTSTQLNDYYAYGQYYFSLNDQTGQADWGYNPINNGGNIEKMGWHTLSKEEWDYLFNTRSTASGFRYAKANVNNVNGVILLPDSWSADTYSLDSTNSSNASYSSNEISATQWITLENAGAVFMPAAGNRNRTSVYDIGHGCYWSATNVNSGSQAYSVFFGDSYLSSTSQEQFYWGLSVRLVCPAGNYSFGINVTPNIENAGTVSGIGTYQWGDNCTLRATPLDGYTFCNWRENGIVVSTEASYSFVVLRDRNLEANFVQEGTVIVFADANVKSICVAQWDTNGDGELSYDEASTVTNIGTVFKNNSTITSFDELQYFTGLTSIGNDAFENCNGLTSIVIPNSVITLGNYVFENCTSLTSIELPNSVTTLGNSVFYNCMGMTSIEIPNSVTTLGNLVFFGCSGLTSLTIPASVVSIGYGLCAGCDIEQLTVAAGNTTYDSRNNCNAVILTSSNSLVAGCKNTIINNSVISLNNSAFYYCVGLTSLTIPNSVTSIGSYAFKGCSELTSITFPSSIASIGKEALVNCTNLNTVYFNATNCTLETIQYYEKYWLDGCSSLVNMIIGDNVQVIPDNFMNSCIVITSILIPSSVNSIGNYAFQGCSGLTSVVIPNSVNSIGNYAFKSCSGLISITIPNSVTSIGSYAFSSCSGLTSITIPNSVTSIGSSAFYNCKNLTYISLGNSVFSIGDNAFGNSTNISCLLINAETPPTLASSSFYNVSRSIPVYVPSSSMNAYRIADYWSEFTNYLNINNSYYQYYQITATANPTNLGTITIEGSNTGGGSTFALGSNVTLTATANDGYAFVNWTKNSEVVSTNEEYFITVTENANYVANFGYEITAISNLDEGGTISGAGAYGLGQTCTLTATANNGYIFGNWIENGEVVSTDNPYSFEMTSNRNLVANFVLNEIVFGDYTYILDFATGEASVKANNTSVTSSLFATSIEYQGISYPVTSISQNGFRDCSNILQMIIPNSINTIGNGAFAGCVFTKVVIPSSVISIGQQAFFNCSSLKEVVFEDGSELIILGNNKYSDGKGGGLFENCPVEKAYIGRNIAVSNYYDSYNRPWTNAPFSRWWASSYAPLKDVTIGNDVTQLCDYFFEKCNSIEFIVSGIQNPEEMTMGTGVFRNVDKSIPIYVPCGSVASYQNTTGWNEFTNIVEMCPFESQTLSLSSGRNWISFNVNITLDDLKAAIVDALPGTAGMKITSQGNGYTQYNGSMWRGGLNIFDVTQMYRIEVPAACEITLLGLPIDVLEHSVTINPGNNWIAFPLSTSMSVNNAFAGFPESGDKISSQGNGYTQYNGSVWRGGLQTLEPGKGYIYNSAATGPKTFVFPINPNKGR